MTAAPTTDTPVAIVLARAKLEPAWRDVLRQTFDTFYLQVADWREKAGDIQVTALDQVAEMALARESRLGLRSIRVAAEHARKRLKANALEQGRCIDALYKVIEAEIAPLEDHLAAQESFADRYHEARRAELRAARAAKLAPYAAPPDGVDLAGLDDDAWRAVLFGARHAHEKRLETERVAREAAELEARSLADEREAQRVEHERVRAENDRLRAEAKARDDAAAEERCRAAQATRAAEDAARVERERVASAARAAKAEADRQADEDRRALEAERQRAAEAEARLTELRRLDDERQALTAAAKRPASARYTVLLAALHRLAVWGDGNDPQDWAEPQSTTIAREALAAVGEGRPQMMTTPTEAP